MVWVIIAIIATALFLTSLIVQLKEKKDIERRTNIKPSFITERYWLVDTQNTDKVFQGYRHELEENDDYHLSAKELREDFTGDKVYKYLPLDLPLKLDGIDVYTYVDKDEWFKVGRLKKGTDTDGECTLRFFVNEYKYITEDNIDKDKGNDYFGVIVKKQVTHDQ